VAPQFISLLLFAVILSFLSSSLSSLLAVAGLLHPALEPEDDHDDDDGAARHEPKDEEAVRGLEEGKVLELQAGGREEGSERRRASETLFKKHKGSVWLERGRREGGREGGRKAGQTL
jgi:hypothetical protein